jgi:type IV secretory pathway ATPase VirB11/archaellum biosynthesis ATPase
MQPVAEAIRYADCGRGHSRPRRALRATRSALKLRPARTVLGLLFVVALAAWVHAMTTERRSVHTIHALMAVLCAVKV